VPVTPPPVGDEAVVAVPDQLGQLGGAPGDRLAVLLVEDDPGDAFLVRELLLEANAPVVLTVAESMSEARPLLDRVDCVLLDLGLPDAHGLSALREVLRHAASSAVCVLTGLEDEHLGIAAVAEGAQDYLVKGKVDGVLLARALRYAVERKRADENVRRLREVELRQAESRRLERGLLPQPLMSSSATRLVSFYRPGRHRALLGADFYDAIETEPHRLHLLVGDVCGHGVDEAALGVALRVAWRALVLAGVGEDAVLPALEQVLVSERRSDEIFATVVTVTVDLVECVARARLAGHPPPLLLDGGAVTQCQADPGMVLGVLPGFPCPVAEIPLTGDDWGLLLYTDGLIDGHTEPGGDRLGVEGLLRMLSVPGRAAVPHRELPAWLVGHAEERNGGPLSDDVAMLLLTPGGAE
jgi:serine phosphatase RsbU (regulator of sigma subunit)